MVDVDKAVREVESKAFYHKVKDGVRKALENPSQYRVEAGELAEPMLKSLEDEIVKACEDHEDAHMPVYIHAVHVRDPISGNVVRNKVYVRYSRPEPLPNSYLWRYSRRDGLEFQWCLPEESIIEMVLTHPERDQKFDRHLVNFMKLYRSNQIDRVASVRA